MSGQRALVLLSLPQLCQLCEGKRVVGLVQLLGFPAVGRIRCPHCDPEPGREPVPLFPTPHRTDRSA